MWTDQLLRRITTQPAPDNKAPTLLVYAANLLGRLKRIEPMILVWWSFALSILCSSAIRMTNMSSGFSYYVLVVAGSGGCAWFWLLSRMLFRRRKDWRPRMFAVVPVAIVFEALAALMIPVGPAGIAGEAGRVFGNAASMICVTAIVFIYKEVLQGYHRLRCSAERHFRVMFVAGFSLVVGIAILWLSGAGDGSVAATWKSALLTTCAILTVAGSRVVVWYRFRNPLQQALSHETDKDTVEGLVRRIQKAIGNDDLLTTVNLKVADFADQLGEQEYKITRCITNHLQFRNFNHFLNSHRIDRAKHIFQNPETRHLTISTVAYDCGFNSLGPFNRAFKEFTGMTPREFRQQQPVS